MSDELKSIDDGLRDLDASELSALPFEPAAEKEKARLRHNRRVQAKRFARLNQNKRAAEHIGELPQPGTALHGCMNGSYSGWSLIEAVLELAGCPVTEMLVSSLGFNIQNALALFALLDAGRGRDVTMLISHYFRHSDPQIYQNLHTGLIERGQQCHVLRNHAKLVLFHLDDGRRFCLEGSFNLRSSMNHEQFLLVDDSELYDFHKSWLTDLIREHEECEQTAD